MRLKRFTYVAGDELTREQAARLSYGTRYKLRKRGVVVPYLRGGKRGPRLGFDVHSIVKTCQTCGCEFKPGYAFEVRVYCSQACARTDPAHAERRKLTLQSAWAAMLASRRERGKKMHPCQVCGALTITDPRTKTCSAECCAKIRPPREKRPCRICAKEVIAPRIFCSQKCYSKSGLRAHSAMPRRYSTRKDENQSEIVDALRAAGCGVIDMSDHGRGLPDLIVHHPRKGTQLVEVKNANSQYGKRGPNKNQREWADRWSAPVYVIKNMDDVEKFVTGQFADLFSYGGAWQPTKEQENHAVAEMKRLGIRRA